MKIEKVSVSRGKKVNLGNYETENYEISMQVELEAEDDVHDIINGLKNIIDQKLENWEITLKQSAGLIKNVDLTTDIKTADTLIKESESANIEIPSESQNSDPVEKKYICPKCKEPMHKKENKDYYLCSKHWGYPDMIEKGEVREKQF